MKAFDVKDLKLAVEGKLKIEWAGAHMPVLATISERFSKTKPLKGYKVGACLHITSETANLLIALKAGGADIVACASNPLSTQDSVASSLVKDFGIPVFAINGENNKVYYKHLNTVLDFHPQITLDDGADLVTLLHTKRKKQLTEVIGSSEETTTGVIRLKAMEKDRTLKIPVLAVNDSDTKHLFDNRYGTGQSTIDGILRGTNILLAGKKFVVCGYGWCGRGIATRARGMGAHVIVTEVDPVKALEAAMDGFVVMSLNEAIKEGLTDIVVSATGDKHVINKNHLDTFKSGAILANSGHFDVEIDMKYLEKKKKTKRKIRQFLQEYTTPDGRVLYVIGDGRLVNLVAAEGHPAEVMDMSFANQALAAEYFISKKGTLENKVHVLPRELDLQVASLKLASMGITIDSLTDEQKKYLSSWSEGTE